MTLALIGCAQSHPPEIAGVSSERRMVELTDDEWRAVCTWRERLRGDTDLIYECDGAVRAEPACASCVQYIYTFDNCFEGPCSRRSAFRDRRDREWCGPPVPAACELTLARWAACEVALERLECWAAYPSPPECHRLPGCSPVVDAGVLVDAGDG